jgi:hypothetical protein
VLWGCRKTAATKQEQQLPPAIPVETTIVPAVAGAVTLNPVEELKSLQSEFVTLGSKALRVALRMGELLTIERAKFPERGPNAKGWGELLRECGISQQSAWRYIQLWGSREKFSLTVSEIDLTEAYHLTGILKRKALPKSATDSETDPTKDPAPTQTPAKSWTAPEVSGTSPGEPEPEQKQQQQRDTVTDTVVNAEFTAFARGQLANDQQPQQPEAVTVMASEEEFKQWLAGEVEQQRLKHEERRIESEKYWQEYNKEHPEHPAEEAPEDDILAWPNWEPVEYSPELFSQDQYEWSSDPYENYYREAFVMEQVTKAWVQCDFFEKLKSILRPCDYWLAIKEFKRGAAQSQYSRKCAFNYHPAFADCDAFMKVYEDKKKGEREEREQEWEAKRLAEQKKEFIEIYQSIGTDFDSFDRVEECDCERGEECSCGYDDSQEKFKEYKKWARTRAKAEKEAAKANRQADKVEKIEANTESDADYEERKALFQAGLPKAA